MEKTLHELGLIKLNEVKPRKPEDLIKGMIKTGDINLIGYYQGTNITPLLSSLTAAVTNGTTFAGQPSTTDSTVILLSAREPLSFMAHSMRANDVNMNRVVAPNPATEYNLNIDYIKMLLENTKDPALLIIDSLENIPSDEEYMFPQDIYAFVRKIANICADRNCALVITSEIEDPEEDYDETENEDIEEGMLLPWEILRNEQPKDYYGLANTLSHLMIVGTVMPENKLCLLDQPMDYPLAKLLNEFDVDENGKVIWITEQ